MERDRGYADKEGSRKRKQTLFVAKSVVSELVHMPLPQRRSGGRGGGGCAMMPSNLYSNVADEQLPWQLEDVGEILRSSGLSEGTRQSLMDIFGRTIVALRKGQSVSIAIEKVKIPQE